MKGFSSRCISVGSKYRTGKSTVCRCVCVRVCVRVCVCVHVCTFQPRTLTGWGSEGVKNSSKSNDQWQLWFLTFFSPDWPSKWQLSWPDFIHVWSCLLSSPSLFEVGVFLYEQIDCGWGWGEREILHVWSCLLSSLPLFEVGFFLMQKIKLGGGGGKKIYCIILNFYILYKYII